MQYKKLTLDPFQEQAINAIENNQSVVVSAPTGSGKTLTADFIIEKHKNDNLRIIYTAPIKALSNQKYRDFSQEYGKEKVGLMTGDIVINPSAKILIMTTEIYRNMVVSNDEMVKDIAYVIFDEIHFINDIERGYVWEESIIYSPESVRFLCLSATIPNAEEFSHWIKAIKYHPVKTVISEERPVPLQMLFYDYEWRLTSLDKIKSAVDDPEYKRMRRQKSTKRFRIPAPEHTALIKDLGRDKLPCIFFVFSRSDCQRKAVELARKNLFPKNYQTVQLLNDKLKDAPSEITRLSSTRMLKETLPFGIAFHHAGLLPVIKETIEELFTQGLIRVLYATETFAVGINMPAKTVCFDGLRKFDGINFRSLTTKEFFQMAGRAGRRGIDKIGYAISMIFRPNFNYPEIKRITLRDIEPIRSQFRLSVNTTLNLIDQNTPEEIEHILRLSFWSYQKFGDKFAKIPYKVLMARYDSIVRKLSSLDYIKEGKLTEKGKFSSKIFSDEITMGEIFATDIVSKLDEYYILLLLAALAYECKSFFEVLEQTNLLEGDLIRFFTQILDKIGQVKKASMDFMVIRKMENCERIMKRALEGIYLL
ncbi:DEAD/DEAH box helicase [Candidatus Woesearchaeota archaeon]|nr:DEAD/DEAH box helicase [Candidatus Woesearchaeota archaeon]